MALPVQVKSPKLHNFPHLSLWSTNHLRTRRLPPPDPDPERRRSPTDRTAPNQSLPLPPSEGDQNICLKSDKTVKNDVQADEEEDREDTEDDSLVKTWNLRPRKQPKSNLNNNLIEKKTEAKKEKKRKFSISLSKIEIEEDVYAMIGTKPARRPKKRPRTVQKQLDNVFPGLWLASITPDCYKVSEAPQ